MSRSAAGNMARGWTLSAAKLVSGILRIKLVALAIGVAGLGGFTLASQIAITGVTFVGMSLAIPIINLGRPAIARGDLDEAGAIAGTALATIFTNIVIFAVVMVLLGDQLLASAEIADLSRFTVPGLIAATAIGALAGGFWEGMVYLTDRFDLYVKAGITSAVLDLILFGAGATFFKLDGAIVALALSPLGLLSAYALFLRKDVLARQILARLSVRLNYLPRLLAYSAMMLATVAITNLVLTTLRAHVLVESGKAANGYLQTATALASYLLAFVTTGVWGHLHARAASEGDTVPIRAEFEKTVRLAMLMSFAGCGVTAILSPYLLPIFYAADFSPGAALVRLYMAGEFAFQIMMVIAAYQLTVRRRRAYVTFNMAYILSLLASGWLLIDRFGAAGFAYAHIAAGTLAVAIAASLAWRRGQLTGAVIVVGAALYAVLVATLALDSLYDSLWAKVVLLVPFGLASLAMLNQLIKLRRG